MNKAGDFVKTTTAVCMITMRAAEGNGNRDGTAGAPDLQFGSTNLLRRRYGGKERYHQLIENLSAGYCAVCGSVERRCVSGQTDR